MRKVHLSKKRIAIIVLILTLVATNVALAYQYMNRDVAISGGVATSGAIAVYNLNGVTPLTSVDFPDFTADEPHSYNQVFFFNNTGNVAVNVYWYISIGNPNNWSIEPGGQAYIFTESAQTKYRFSINNHVLPDGSQGTGVWNPDPTGTQVLTIGVRQGAKFSIDLLHYVAVNTPGDFSFTLSFYA